MGRPGPGDAPGPSAEPLSWPELFGLIATATGHPETVGNLDGDDVADLQASWRLYPPTHLALHRIERVLMTAHGLTFEEPDAGEAVTPPDGAPPTEAELQRMVDMLNRQLGPLIPRNS